MGKYFLRFARSGHFFLLGLGSIADISGNGLISITPQEEMLSPLARDFQAVGDDIRFAISQYKTTVQAKDPNQLELTLR